MLKGALWGTLKVGAQPPPPPLQGVPPLAKIGTSEKKKRKSCHFINIRKSLVSNQK